VPFSPEPPSDAPRLEPPLLARGRAADVFDLGDRVLRRNRFARPAEREATLLRFAAEHGVPVPAVLESDGTDLVMAKVDGPVLMLNIDDDATAARAGRLLAELHRSLDDVPAPPGLPAVYDDVAPRLLHGDLHPGNVLMSPAGPVLIDWDNASAGPRAADVAETWVLLGCFDPGVPGWPARREVLLAAFLDAVDIDSAARWLPAVGERRLADRNTRGPEAERIKALVQTRGRR